MRTQGLSSVVLSHTPHCLPLSPLVCHSNFLEGKDREESSQHQGICNVSYVWYLQKALRGTVVSPEYKRQRHHKQAAAYLQLTKAARAVCDITHAALPPSQPATTSTNYPTGIESSAGPCLLERLDMWAIARGNLEPLKAVDTELLWVQAVWSHWASDCLSLVKYATIKAAVPII